MKAADADRKTAQLIAAMITFDCGYPDLIHHFLKVHNFAKTIGELENVDPDTLFTLETAAVVHDIGIRYCLEQFGSCEGPLQEKYGPAFAEELLGKMGYEQEITDRVSWLVAHHHTYTNVEGIDYRILLEADFLVNSLENKCSEQAIRSFMDRVFETKTGKTLLMNMFHLE